MMEDDKKQVRSEANQKVKGSDSKVDPTPFFERVKEMLFTAWFISVPLGSLLLTALLCFYPKYYFLTIPYFLYVLCDKSYKDGSRRSKWYRSLPVFDYMRKYFRSELICLHEFQPENKYLIAYHPHGILGFGAWSTLAMDGPATKNQKKGLNLCVVTLSQNFIIPFLRDIVLGFGFIDSNKETLVNILSKDNGLSCAIVVGGAAEALKASPDRADLVLAKRYGFIKLALQTGAWLTPSYGFGENDSYFQYFPPHGSILANFQHWFKKISGVGLPFIIGRGFSENSVGLLPQRGPITVVVGNPIEVEKVDDPTDEQIQKLHAKYIDQLQQLYDNYKQVHADRVFELTGQVYNSPELRIV